MTTLVNALRQNDSVTENGMVTNSTSLNNCLDLFFKVGAFRKADESRIISTFSLAFNEDPLTAIRTLFWVRDVRGGAGERRVFRVILNYLISNHISALLSVLEHIPFYGRWDDLLHVYTNVSDISIKTKVLALILKGLADKSTSGLCAKWMPRKGKVANELRKVMGITPKEYRKILVSLTNVVETAMCSNDWNGIDYSKVPSVAFSRYKGAFSKHDPSGFSSFVTKVAKGEAKINASAIYPYDIIHSLRHSRNIDTKNASCEQWKLLPNYLTNTDCRLLPVVDVSGSMDCPVSQGSSITCMDVALSLGLYISERNEGPFKDAFITFSSNPQLQVLKGNLTDRLNQMERSQWSMSTNLERVFKLVLNQASKFKVSEQEMPTHIVILSDMEFNQCVMDRDDTAISMMRRMFDEAGYKLPNIIFWNIQSRGNNVPVRFNEDGVGLVSGFSPSILTSLLSGEIDPIRILNRTVHSERYSRIVL